MGTSSMGWAGSSGFLWRILSLVKKTLLCVCYLENHVFLDPEIERTIATRDVFIGDGELRASSSCISPKIIFIGAHGQEF
jgi:hypothetical protein